MLTGTLSWLPIATAALSRRILVTSERMACRLVKQRTASTIASRIFGRRAILIPIAVVMQRTASRFEIVHLLEWRVICMHRNVALSRRLRRRGAAHQVDIRSLELHSCAFGQRVLVDRHTQPVRALRGIEIARRRLIPFVGNITAQHRNADFGTNMIVDVRLLGPTPTQQPY